MVQKELKLADSSVFSCSLLLLLSHFHKCLFFVSRETNYREHMAIGGLMLSGKVVSSSHITWPYHAEWAFLNTIHIYCPFPSCWCAGHSRENMFSANQNFFL
ncbi:hypothetical protein AMECASPLE_023849 [Ameca splendens]|uniref:Uncharacterized protein n=1 Tax=Ameca splendens TaxID=208324 RepID=A0ABV0XH70_9TELE